jgi:4-diphosphocytidyl-2-C-methyl-D-erythritol kinase
MAVTVFSPAKINLYLAVTGRRADGYHDLVSVVAPLDFGDELKAWSKEQGAGSREAEGQFTLECDRADVPVDDSNLVLRAARAFSAATGYEGRVAFKLTKRIPLGAGLGGGSSNAVAALRALNRLTGDLLPEAQLAGVAAGLGSDCALFLHQAPVVMRGRGERVELLPGPAASRLRGCRVLLFKPGFGISTAWAYRRMAARGNDYIPAAEAERTLSTWMHRAAPAGELLDNNLEGAAFEKFPALPVLLGKLRADCGVAGRLSGSGSACFALPDDPSAGSGRMDSVEVVTEMKQTILQCWGPPAWVQEARLA